MGVSEDNIKAYFEKILQIQSNQSENLSEAELKEIAVASGLSEGDFQQIEKYFDDHFRRGKSYLEYQNWQDAINEFEQILTLKPKNAELLSQLALAYSNLWLGAGGEKNKEKAHYYAKKALEVAPENATAHQVITVLRNGRLPKANKSWLPLLLGVMALVAFIAAVTLYSWKATESRPIDKESPLAIEEPEIITDTDIDNRNNQIKVDLVQDKQVFDLELVNSNINLYKNSFSYVINGFLIPKNVEVSKLALKVELFDENGKLYLADFKDIHPSYQPSIRKGDKRDFHVLIYREQIPPNIAKVALSISELNTLPVPDSYNPSPKIDYEWVGQAPNNFDLEIRERFSSLKPSVLDKKAVQHKLQLEIKNTGKANIKKMKILVEWYGSQNQSLGTHTKIVALSSETPIPIGNTRVSYILASVPNSSVASIASYKVKILEVE